MKITIILINYREDGCLISCKKQQKLRTFLRINLNNLFVTANGIKVAAFLSLFAVNRPGYLLNFITLPDIFFTLTNRIALHLLTGDEKNLRRERFLFAHI